MPAVLFATIAAGGGHVATARAMAEAVTAASGGSVQVRVSDVMAEYGPQSLDARHKASWKALLGMPPLVRASQRLMDAAPPLSRAVQNRLLQGFTTNVTTALNQEAPTLVVVNHGWLATAFTRARALHGLKSRVAVFATEPFDASALWSAPLAETVLAPSAAAAEDLVRLGVPSAAVHVAGYPVAERFTTAPDRATARERFALGDDFVVLMSLGAEGVASSAAIAAALALGRAGCAVLCVTGRNEELAGRLTREAALAGLSDRVRALGFVERMELPLAACDVMVGKAGPASTLEALAVGRPVIAATYAGLNELAVVRFLAANGLGEHAGSFTALPDVVARWRDDPGRLESAGRTAAALDFGAMTAGIGAFLAALAVHGEADPALLKPGALAAITKRSLAPAPAPVTGVAP